MGGATTPTVEGGTMATALIRASHKPIRAYYDQLRVFAAQGVSHESATRMAFQNLLAETAQSHRWTLIPELSMKVRGRTIRPDGTLRDDEWKLHRGYWEAKDTSDSLNDEIVRKVDKGYPLLNTIFEDTREGILFQDGAKTFRADLGSSVEIADLLNLFYGHTQRDFAGFERAADEFKHHVPRLASGLLSIIQTAHRENPDFVVAYETLIGICRSSINPHTSVKTPWMKCLSSTS